MPRETSAATAPGRRPPITAAATTKHENERHVGRADGVTQGDEESGYDDRTRECHQPGCRGEFVPVAARWGVGSGLTSRL